MVEMRQLKQSKHAESMRCSLLESKTGGEEELTGITTNIIVGTIEDRRRPRMGVGHCDEVVQPPTAGISSC